MPLERSYRIFARYMEISHAKFNPTTFKSDDMTFCKIWKAHRKAFGEICAKHDCREAWIDLNERFVNYETSILDMNYRNGRVTNIEYDKQLEYIQRKYI